MRTGTPLIGAPKFKPRRDRHIRSRSADCPDCKVVAPNPCLSKDGTELAKCHPSRRRMAVRADNLARGI